MGPAGIQCTLAALSPRPSSLGSRLNSAATGVQIMTERLPREPQEFVKQELASGAYRSEVEPGGDGATQDRAANTPIDCEASWQDSGHGEFRADSGLVRMGNIG